MLPNARIEGRDWIQAFCTQFCQANASKVPQVNSILVVDNTIEQLSNTIVLVDIIRYREQKSRKNHPKRFVTILPEND